MLSAQFQFGDSDALLLIRIDSRMRQQSQKPRSAQVFGFMLKFLVAGTECCSSVGYPLAISELVRVFAEIRRIYSKYLKPLDYIIVPCWTLKIWTLGGLDGSGSRTRMVGLCSSLLVC